MLLRTPDLLLISSLVEIDPAKNLAFRDKEKSALAGRCLLDTLEYLRAIPQYSAQFRQVTNAHTIRLACRCLSDPHLDRRQVLDRMKFRILDTCRKLREKRNDTPPHYGDDFWDWAIVIESLIEVQSCFPNTVIDGSTVTDDAVIDGHLKSFYESVEAKIDGGLTAPESGAEWYGPATAVVAYRLLDRFKDRFNGNVVEILEKLREQALEPIENGCYRGKEVPPYQILWHYGQVVAEFLTEATAPQAQAIADLSALKPEVTPAIADRVYALARVLQGALKLSNKALIDESLKRLFRFEATDRPLGQGILGENVKGPLNVLEALWPWVQPGQKLQIGAMIDALLQAQVRTNTVGIVVAIDHEAKAARKAFCKAKAKISESGDATMFVEHADYRAVICQGKALIDVTEATHTLIKQHKVKWLIMFGIAGSLGSFVKSRSKKNSRNKKKSRNKKIYFKGPDKGQVVAATSLAPFRIYDKVRTEIVNAKVPFHGDNWLSVPTDPTLFALAHEAGQKQFGTKLFEKMYHEGLIVTGTGIKDGIKVKHEIHREFAGGLAVETEGYAVALIAMHNDIPCMVIRGISDRAQGDKKKQGKKPKKEKAEQSKAALAAAKITVGVVELLSQQW
jgi:nucleoside phosphorylase